MDDIVIEKGIPIPEGRSGVTSLLRSMAIGDSIVISRRKRESWGPTLKRLAPMKFTGRSIDEVNVRLWRVE